MNYQVSIMNSVTITLRDGRRVAYSLPCDKKGRLYIKWNTDAVEKSADRIGKEERRKAIELSPREGYFSSHEQRVPRRFHFAFYLQLRALYNIESWRCDDIKSMRTCWCYSIGDKQQSERGQRARRRRRISKR